MKPTMDIRTSYLKLCRGVDGSGCSYGLGVSADFSGRIERTVELSGWPEFLTETHGAELNRHHGFQIHVTACPNGCSRPHIADIGLIRACEPQVDAQLCTSCGECADGCPDDAIVMADGVPIIDRSVCINCGKCALVCPVEAMSCVRQGWRVLVGGRLGRHPQLATELEGWQDDDGALMIIKRALELYMAHYAPPKRFGRILDELGCAALLEDKD